MKFRKKSFRCNIALSNLNQKTKQLIQTIKVYLTESTLRVELVLLVAIMGIARKALLVDFDNTDGVALLALAARG